MAEKVERSKKHAAAALAAYRESYDEQGAPDPDDVAAIGDLIADLCHLAADRMQAAEAEEGCEVAWDGAVSVHGLVLTQLDHFDYERDPANADVGV